MSTQYQDVISTGLDKSMPHPELPYPDWRESGDERAKKPKLYVIMECSSDGRKEVMEVHSSMEYAEQECWLYNNSSRGRGSMKYHIEMKRLYGSMYCE